MTVDEAKASFEAARKTLLDADSARKERLTAIHLKHDPIVMDALIALGAAQNAMDKAVAEATHDHPLHGRKVFKNERIYQKGTWNRRVIGEKRRDGILHTYRPGDTAPRYGYVKPGDLIVVPVLKSGKMGAKPERYDDEWQLSD